MEETPKPVEPTTEQSGRQEKKTIKPKKGFITQEEALKILKERGAKATPETLTRLTQNYDAQAYSKNDELFLHRKKLEDALIRASDNLNVFPTTKNGNAEESGANPKSESPTELADTRTQNEEEPEEESVKSPDLASNPAEIAAAAEDGVKKITAEGTASIERNGGNEGEKEEAADAAVKLATGVEAAQKEYFEIVEKAETGQSQFENNSASPFGAKGVFEIKTESKEIQKEEPPVIEPKGDFPLDDGKIAFKGEGSAEEKNPMPQNPGVPPQTEATEKPEPTSAVENSTPEPTAGTETTTPKTEGQPVKAKTETNDETEERPTQVGSYDLRTKWTKIKDATIGKAAKIVGNAAHAIKEFRPVQEARLYFTTESMNKAERKLANKIDAYESVKKQLDALNAQKAENQRQLEKYSAKYGRPSEAAITAEDQKINEEIAKLTNKLEKRQFEVQKFNAELQRFDNARKNILGSLIDKTEAKLAPRREKYNEIVGKKKELDSTITAFQNQVSDMRAEIRKIEQDSRNAGFMHRLTIGSRLRDAKNELRILESKLNHKKAVRQVIEAKMVHARGKMNKWESRKNAYTRDSQRNPRYNERPLVKVGEANLEGGNVEDRMPYEENSGPENGTPEQKVGGGNVNPNPKSEAPTATEGTPVTAEKTPTINREVVQTAKSETSSTASKPKTEEFRAPEKNEATPKKQENTDTGPGWPYPLGTLLSKWNNFIGQDLPLPNGRVEKKEFFYPEGEIEKKLDLKKEYSFEDFKKLVLQKNKSKEMYVVFGDKKLEELLNDFYKLGGGDRKREEAKKDMPKKQAEKKEDKIENPTTFPLENLVKTWNESEGSRMKLNPDTLKKFLENDVELKKEFFQKNTFSADDFVKIMNRIITTWQEKMEPSQVESVKKLLKQIKEKLSGVSDKEELPAGTTMGN